MKKTALSHIVKETVAHLDNNEDPGTILLTKAVGVLRDQSVEWLVNGFNAINKSEVVKKVPPPLTHLSGSYLILLVGLGVVQSWGDQPFIRMFDIL